MLKSLQIHDYALIEKVYVEFERGLNIITGETGAGKSILIDAMGLLLGERAASEVIRKGTNKAVVEGIFDITGNNKVRKILNENEIDESDELIMRREISLKGANRSFINDTPVSLTIFKDIGNLLVDLHGQHEHQSLLRTEMHIEMLDEFGNPEKDLFEYSDCYKKLLELKNELKSLKQKEEILNEKKDLYAFQIKEIDAVSPEDGEDELLSTELRILENSEKLLESTNRIYENLYDSENAIYDSLVNVRNEISELSRIDQSFKEIEDECRSALAVINDVAVFVRNYMNKIDLEPERLEVIRERLGAFTLLKKKYGGSLKSIIDYRKRIGNDYELAENFTGSIEKLENEILSVRKKCGSIALKISKNRRLLAKKIESEVVDALSYLGIPYSVFQVNIKQVEADEDFETSLLTGDGCFKANSRGIDEVEFLISTNKGEDPKPLVKVASGGEVSRIMLALKTVLAKNDKLPLLIFDEIDTGVSGRIAQKVGQALKSLSNFHQIISITHLPQIAGLADHHFLVEKVSSGDRVTSSIKKLNDENRVREIAKLMSGEVITDSSLKSARELMVKG
jgi:DNA repair protein RecN (Recombination protein N)